MDQVVYTKKVYLERLRIYISKIGVQLHVPKSMSGVKTGKLSRLVTRQEEQNPSKSMLKSVKLQSLVAKCCKMRKI
jgi:hypothetical protein